MDPDVVEVRAIAFGQLAECDCPDFYHIRIHATADSGSPVIYEVFGYITGGNLQIHPPVGESMN